MGTCLGSQHLALPHIPVPPPWAQTSLRPATCRPQPDPSTARAPFPIHSLVHQAGFYLSVPPKPLSSESPMPLQGPNPRVFFGLNVSHFSAASPLCCSSSSSLMDTVALIPHSVLSQQPELSVPSPPSHLTLSRGIKYPHASQLTCPVQACSSFSICGVTKDILSAWDSQTGPRSVNVPHPDLVTQPILHWSQDQDSTATAPVQAISPISRAPLRTF